MATETSMRDGYDDLIDEGMAEIDTFGGFISGMGGG